MWKIEAKQINQGGSIEDGEPIRLKNIKSGMYLLVKMREDPVIEKSRNYVEMKRLQKKAN